MGPVILALLLAMSSLAIAPADDDAGSGADAPDSRDAALELPSEGVYNASLAPEGDRDWYTLDLSTNTFGEKALCTVATIQSGVRASVTLGLDGEQGRDVTRHVYEDHRLTLGIADSPLDGIDLGIEPIESDAVADEGNYAFDLSVLRVKDVSEDDGNTLEAEATDDDGEIIDAGPNATTGITVPAPCFSGWLRGADDVDTYTFEAEDGDPLGLVLIDVPDAELQVDLISPGGTLLGNLTDGTFDVLTLDQAGTWSLQVSTPDTDIGDQPYVMAFSLNGPDPEPCRPTCLLSLS